LRRGNSRVHIVGAECDNMKKSNYIDYSKPEQEFDEGAILRNKHTGLTLTITGKYVTETGSIRYNVIKEGEEDWPTSEGSFHLNHNFELISNPLTEELKTLRIKCIKILKEADAKFLRRIADSVLMETRSEEE